MGREQPNDASNRGARLAPDPVRGALAGLAGGLLASAAMNAFQSAWQALAGSGSSVGGEPSTVQAAEKLATSVGEDPIPEDVKQLSGNAVHYAFGALLGALYGLAAEYVPQITTCSGAVFGVGSMLVLDDAAVPAAGLGAPPTHTTFGTHAYSAASHLIYGVSLEATRTISRSMA